jgi:transposase-like protein
VTQNRPALFRGKQFEDVIIILCVRWYLRYSLSYRDLEEMMAKRGLSLDHLTIWRTGFTSASRSSCRNIL